MKRGGGHYGRRSLFFLKRSYRGHWLLYSDLGGEEGGAGEADATGNESPLTQAGPAATPEA